MHYHNPDSASGIGFEFEHHVQALFLFFLASGKPYALGEDNFIVTELQFQAGASFHTDDLVVTFDNNEILCIQCKMGFSIGNNEGFVKTIGGMWKDYIQALSYNKRIRFLISTNKLTRTDSQAFNMLDWAKTSNNADDFFNKLEKNNSKYKKFALFKKVIEQIVGGEVGNRTLWSFLKLVYVEEKDYLQNISMAEENLELKIEPLLKKEMNGKRALTELKNRIVIYNKNQSTMYPSDQVHIDRSRQNL